MNSSENEIDVTEFNFQTEVIEYSQHTPVLVEFWAAWCQPCKILGSLLEKLAGQAKDGFRHARVDVDANPNLAALFNIRSVPAVKAFRMGQVHSEFMGVIPEERIILFLRDLAPGKLDLAILKGHSLLASNAWKDAETIYRSVLGQVGQPPSDVLLGLVKSLVAQNQIHEAKEIMDRFPVSREYPIIEMLLPLVNALLDETAVDATQPIEATYQRALMLIRKGNLEAGLDGLLGVLRMNKNYRGGTVKKILLGLFEILGPDQLIIRNYRAEMASILF